MIFLKLRSTSCLGGVWEGYIDAGNINSNDIWQVCITLDGSTPGTVMIWLECNGKRSSFPHVGQHQRINTMDQVWGWIQKVDNKIGSFCGKFQDQTSDPDIWSDLTDLDTNKPLQWDRLNLGPDHDQHLCVHFQMVCQPMKTMESVRILEDQWSAKGTVDWDSL